MQVIETGQNKVGEFQCNGNKKEYGREKDVEETASICFTRFFIFFDRQFLSDIYIARMVHIYM
jgi:hypothetical protein